MHLNFVNKTPIQSEGEQEQEQQQEWKVHKKIHQNMWERPKTTVGWFIADGWIAEFYIDRSETVFCKFDLLQLIANCKSTC